MTHSAFFFIVCVFSCVIQVRIRTVQINRNWSHIEVLPKTKLNTPYNIFYYLLQLLFKCDLSDLRGAAEEVFDKFAFKLTVQHIPQIACIHILICLHNAAKCIFE